MIVDMLGDSPSSCRQLAMRLATDKSTIWAWRMKACRTFAGETRPTPPVRTPSPIDAGLVLVRESRKASREWVNHARTPARFPAPDRLRWIDYRRLGLPAPDRLPRYRIPVQIGMDGSGLLHASVLDGHARDRSNRATGRAAPGPKVATAGRSSADRRADASPRPTERLLAPPNTTGVGTVAQTDAGRRFRDFVQPFRGPATRHLPAYVAWFVARQPPRGA